ncbi:MAG TPA: hypothetical protein VL325_01250 [Pyrinomonadaceae bacterium]|nr:hypothetical protein [Pyrinomonadaceae bacterium]
MPIPAEALELENRSLGINYEPTLAEAYKILKAAWDKGNRDREVALHLMFIAWYGIIEPSHITGFIESDEEKHKLNQVLFDVHEHFKARISDDAEMLYTFGLMASMEYYMLERPDYWEKIGIEYRPLYRALAPNGLDSSIFKDRGAYGEYYEMQSQTLGGY